MTSTGERERRLPPTKPPRNGWDSLFLEVMIQEGDWSVPPLCAVPTDNPQKAHARRQNKKDRQKAEGPTRNRKQITNKMKICTNDPQTETTTTNFTIQFFTIGNFNILLSNSEFPLKQQQ